MSAKEETPASRAPLAEWVWAALGLAVLVTLLAALVQHAASSDGAAADLHVDRVAIERGRDAWRVDVRATNSGGATAEDVVVHGELRRDREVVGEAEVVLQYVPAGSERGASLVFREDPRTAELTLEVRGFVRP